MKFFLVDEAQLAWLSRTATRLHSEERMNGDEMRDLGHGLAAIVKVARELEVSEPAACDTERTK